MQKPLPKQAVKILIEAASYAPSAHNAQPWRFIVLENLEAKRALADAMAHVWLAQLELDNIPVRIRQASVKESVKRFSSAPVLVLACLDMRNMNTYPDEERAVAERDLAVVSLGAGIQNLLLSAQEYGLGACWYCAPSFSRVAVRNALGIPSEVEPHALITVGYPAEAPKMPARLPIEEFAFREKWGNSL